MNVELLKRIVLTVHILYSTMESETVAAANVIRIVTSRITSALHGHVLLGTSKL